MRLTGPAKYPDRPGFGFGLILALQGEQVTKSLEMAVFVFNWLDWTAEYQRVRKSNELKGKFCSAESLRQNNLGAVIYFWEVSKKSPREIELMHLGWDIYLFSLFLAESVFQRKQRKILDEKNWWFLVSAFLPPRFLYLCASLFCKLSFIYNEVSLHLIGSWGQFATHPLQSKGTVMNGLGKHRGRKAPGSLMG